MTGSASKPGTGPDPDLSAALIAVRDRVTRVLAHPQAADTAMQLEIAHDSRLGRLMTAFGLSEFELAIVLLGAAVELLPGFDRQCAAVNGHDSLAFPTFGLALAVFPQAHWDALTPEAALRGMRLIELGDGDVLTQRAIRVSERVLHSLLGVDTLDPRLARRLRGVRDPGTLPPAHEALAQRAGRLASASANAPGLTVYLWGDDISASLGVAARSAALRGWPTQQLDAAWISAEPDAVDELARLWTRETKLAPQALAVSLSAGLDRNQASAVANFLRSIEGPTFVVTRESPATDEHVCRVRVDPLPFEEKLELWRAAAGSAATEAILTELSAQFQLGPTAIRNAAAELSTRPAESEASVRDVLWDACRSVARPRMADLAQRVTSRASLRDIVLPDSEHAVLEALVGQVRCRATVFHEWGFAGSEARGIGTSAVFAGPSGTGKTMAAEAIADALRLDLYRIDLSAVVSKYIGETEENLRQVFDAAEAGGAVLLFDEADALFGKRTEVRDSHDRHANIEVSYLLQRMEAYAGLAILTTNLRKALDDAFVRRVQFILEFPFPDATQRERIWSGILPAAAPREALEYGKLAKLSVAGGNIKSIARNAAFIAADDGRPVSMRHMLKAARLEFAKLGRSLPAAEIRGWVA